MKKYMQFPFTLEKFYSILIEECKKKYKLVVLKASKFQMEVSLKYQLL